MTPIDGIILGIVEGLTEFLPVSSSGHLIIARDLLGLLVPNGLAVDAVLQLATVFAVGVYFFRDLLGIAYTALYKMLGRPVSDKDSTLLYAVLLGTIPGVLFGLLLEKTMDTVFRSMFLVGVTLVLGSILFIVAEKYAKKNQTLTAKRGFLIGLFQSLALVPGISRSGATISGGLLLGLSREEATRFSFVLSFPILLGAGLKKFLDLLGSHELGTLGFPFFLASLSAFLVGLMAIHFLIRYLRTHTLYVFVYYRLILAGLIFLVIFAF